MSTSKLFQFFPPPKFLNTPCAGLSLSDNHVRAIEFESTNGGDVRLKKYAELPLPPGAITSGRVNNKEEIVQVLKKLKKDTGIESVRVSLPEEKAYVFEIEIPLVTPKEVRGAIEFKLEENVPLPADQIIFDYAVVEIDHVHNHMRVVVLALPVKFVDIYMDMLTLAGLVPYSLEIESQAFARALISRNDTRTYLIVHLGGDKVSLCIISKKVVHFTSTINVPGGWNNSSESVISEIKKVITYWHSDHPHDSNQEANDMISRCIICGHDFEDSVASHLSVSLHMDVVLGNVWTNAFDINRIVPEVSFIDSLKYASAIGLALPSLVLM